MKIIKLISTVQEWIETGDTDSMNEYIEETSQNVDII